MNINTINAFIERKTQQQPAESDNNIVFSMQSGEKIIVGYMNIIPDINDPDTYHLKNAVVDDDTLVTEMLLSVPQIQGVAMEDDIDEDYDDDDDEEDEENEEN